MNVGIYIHIPFCISKCNYCDFVSFSDLQELYVPYINALIAEIDAAKLGGYLIDTIFIGGGTPTALPSKYIKQILNTLQHYNISKDCEITIESNPGTLTLEKLQNYKSMGINRLSMGLQAWQKCHLKNLGRIHTSSEFSANFEEAKKVGFENINVDIMFSLPNQSFNEWQETYTNVAKLKPTHISTYGLIIEDGTPFKKLYDCNKLTLPSDELDRFMYHEAADFLKNYGYVKYEISNFALPSFECRHNLRYWTRKEYLGVGLNAHSFIGGKRFRNTADIYKYIGAMGNGEKIRRDINLVSKEDAMEEFMFLGLRLKDGISIQDFKNNFEVSIYNIYGKQIEKFVTEGLISEKDNKLFLTDFGIDISNYVLKDFLLS